VASLPAAAWGPPIDRGRRGEKENPPPKRKGKKAPLLPKGEGRPLISTPPVATELGRTGGPYLEEGKKGKKGAYA